MLSRKIAQWFAIVVIAGTWGFIGATHTSLPGSAVSDSVASNIRGGTCGLLGSISCAAGTACKGSYACNGTSSCVPTGTSYCGGTTSCASCWTCNTGTCNN
jgi:hypothetical protein